MMYYILINKVTLEALCYEKIAPCRFSSFWSETVFNPFTGRRQIYGKLLTFNSIEEAEEEAKNYMYAEVAKYDACSCHIMKL